MIVLSRIWMKARPWLIGVLLSATAMFLGYALGSETAELLGGEPGIWARMGKGFVWGGIVAGVQWPIVRAIGVSPVRFIVASAAAFAVGYPLGQNVQGVLDRGLYWTWGYGSALTIFGLSLGVPQWWISRRHVRRAGLWILLSVAGWILTGVAWIHSRAGDGVDAVMYGAVMGLGLVWLVHSQTPNAEVRASPRGEVSA